MQTTRYGVIGIKGMGSIHIEAARANEEVELVALADVDEAGVNEAAVRYGVRGFTDYLEMLEAGLLDAVSIVLPHNLHFPVGMDCLKAGLHVFMEKPFASRVSEIDAMLALAEKSELHICVGHQYRTQRSAQRIKQILDSGAIGIPTRVLWSWGEFRSRSYYRRGAWRNTFQGSGGGVLMSQASHDLDLLCWLVGTPVQVSAMAGNQIHDVEMEDIAGASILFDSGAMASYQCTYNHPKGYSVRQIEGDRGIIVMPNVQSLTYDQDEEILVGTYEGSLSDMVEALPEKDQQPAISWKSCGFKRPERSRHKPGLLTRGLRRLGALRRPAWRQAGEKPVGGVRELVDSFVDAVRHGGEPLVTGRSARTTIELINAMYLSAIRKKTVELPLDPHEYDKLFEELVKGEVSIPRWRSGGKPGSSDQLVSR